ncbi:MAG: inositol monophosphatase [Planctomycetes bacterium]|nr:inositol monophosphatase [Planctomycetota bacterium]
MPDSDLHHIITLAQHAGDLIRASWGKAERQTKRGGAEAVTEIDRLSQRLIIAGLRDRHPDDGIIGEESDSGEGITNTAPTTGERVWVIDPLDGTNNFVAGLGHVAVCIGLLDRGMPVLGVVHDVARDQTFAAARGEGAWLDTRPILAATTPLSERALLMMTSNLLIDGRLPPFLTRWLTRSPCKVRMLGSAALEAVQVAAGIAHGALTLNGKLWDLVAPAAILAEAGATVTDLAGQPVFPYDLTGYSGAKVPFLAGGPLAHRELLEDMRAHWA